MGNGDDGIEDVHVQLHDMFSLLQDKCVLNS